MFPQLKAFVLRPESWFRRRTSDLHGARALVIAFLVAMIVTLQAGGFLWLVSERMTGTITRDNPDRPPEWMCDDGGDSPFSGTDIGETDGTPAGCTEPKQETVEIGTVVWQEATGVLPTLFVGMLLLWLIGGVAIHLLIGGIGTEGTVGQTLEVLAWCGVVQVVTIAIVVPLLVLSLPDGALSASDPEAVLSAVRALGVGPIGILTTAVSVAGTLWQSYVLFGGLTAVHEASRIHAASVSALFAIVLLLTALT
ncbi:Yip1 family protein [Halorhabdus rudnickae]|uniref:Yip1 family protein n=1 Tax=Halorhabdus rudnickae TaxID=1775544 RepID=UPI001438271B|nr:Yip1 family protein [Halorhabdus rudnickae]